MDAMLAGESDEESFLAELLVCHREGSGTTSSSPVPVQQHGGIEVLGVPDVPGVAGMAVSDEDDTDAADFLAELLQCHREGSGATSSSSAPAQQHGGIEIPEVPGIAASALSAPASASSSTAPVRGQQVRRPRSAGPTVPSPRSAGPRSAGPRSAVPTSEVGRSDVRGPRLRVVDPERQRTWEEFVQFVSASGPLPTTTVRIPDRPCV